MSWENLKKKHWYYWHYGEKINDVVVIDVGHFCDFQGLSKTACPQSKHSKVNITLTCTQVKNKSKILLWREFSNYNPQWLICCVKTLLFLMNNKL